MPSFTEAPLARIVVVTSENQELKLKLTESQTQYESLEQQLRFQTAKASELQDMLALNSKGDMGALMTKIMEHSMAVAEQTLVIDQLKKKLRESEKEKRIRDQEREAHIEMMSELNRVIRQQQVEIKTLENPSSLTPEDYEYDEIDSELDQLCNIHDHLKDVKIAVEKKDTTVVVERNPAMDKINNNVKQLLAERALLKRKVEVQNATISILQQRSKTREANNIALVKGLKEKYEREKRELQETRRSLEAQIQMLQQQNEEQSEAERSTLHGELIEIESQNYEPLLFLSDTKADCEVFEDDASEITDIFLSETKGDCEVFENDDNSEITANTFPNSDSDQSSPASAVRQQVSLDAYVNFGCNFSNLESVDFSTQRFEI